MNDQKPIGNNTNGNDESTPLKSSLTFSSIKQINQQNQQQNNSNQNNQNGNQTIGNRSTLKSGMANFTQSCLAYLQRSLTIKLWIEKVLGEKIDRPLFEGIRDGVLLCRVMMLLKADSIPRVHTNTTLNFKWRENLLFYIQALEDIGVSRYYQFQVTDLLDRKNDIKVLESLEVLSDMAGEIDTKFAIDQLPEDGPISFTDAEMADTESILKKLNVSHLKRQPCKKALFANEPINNYNNATTNKHRSITTSRSFVPSSSSSFNSSLSTSSSSSSSSSTPSSSSFNSSLTKVRPPLSPFQIMQKSKPYEKKWIKIQALVRGHLTRKKFHRRLRYAAYRHNIVKELLSTETIYVKNLEHLTKYYFEPIQENSSKLGIKPEHLKQMFSNIEVIKNYNQRLLEDLCPIIEDWSHSKKIGFLFIQFILLLKVYTQYVKEYTQSYEILSNYRKNNSKFESFIFEKETADSKSMGDYLILPVQRIPRYTLLLADLVKNTWVDHRDYKDLTESLKQMQAVATYVNEKKREAENIQKVTEIQNNFIGKFENLAEPHRRFVYEGTLHVINPNGKESQRIIYLFNDVLIGTKPTTSGLVKRKDALKVKESIRMNLVSLRTPNKPTSTTNNNTNTNTNTTTTATTTTTPTNNLSTSNEQNRLSASTNSSSSQSSSTSSTLSSSTPPLAPKPSAPKPPPRSALSLTGSSNGSSTTTTTTPLNPSSNSAFKTATHSSNTPAPTQQYLRQSAPPATGASTKPPIATDNSFNRNRTSTNSPTGIAPLPKLRTSTTSTNNNNTTNNNTPTTNSNNNNSQSTTTVTSQPPTTTTNKETNNEDTSSSSTTGGRNELIIELVDSFGTCILKLLCNSKKERDSWINEFKKVQEDLDNRKIVNEDAMKRSQERAGLAKAALSQQYATLRIKGRLYGQSDIKNAIEDGSGGADGASPGSGSPVGGSPLVNGASVAGERDFQVLRRQTLRRSNNNSPNLDSGSSSPTSIGSVSPKGSKEDLTSSSSAGGTDASGASDHEKTANKSRWFASLRSKKKKPSSSTLIQDVFSPQPLEPLQQPGSSVTLKENHVDDISSSSTSTATVVVSSSSSSSSSSSK